MKSVTDPWGRSLLDVDAAIEALYAGHSLADIYVTDPSEVERFNAVSVAQGLPQTRLRVLDTLTLSPEEVHAQRASQWLLGDERLDVRAHVLALCRRDDERARVMMEMDLYEERGLVPLLRGMIALVAHFRTNKIVWGVGRGSSVSSYVLYLIGVHQIDSLRYGLDVREFLK